MRETRRATTQKSLSKKPETRARTSTLQRDKLLTQSEILKKETSPPAKEADEHSEAEPDEAKHGQDLSQNGGEMAAAMLLISRWAGVLANHSRAIPRHGAPRNRQ